MMARSLALLLFVVSVFVVRSMAVTFSLRLVHRFSDEMKGVWASRGGKLPGSWPEKRSLDYYKLLASSDFHRQTMKLGTKYPLLFPTEGSETVSLGNEFGWLHYTWIDIGIPSKSFFVALDAGSDLLWVPCNCVQCAPLSASHYSSLDRDLSEYDPSGSRTSKYVSCSHGLCDSGANCKSPEEKCPYTMSYYSKNTSSSGLLVEDMLHLSSGGSNRLNASVKAHIIVGCGMKQTGGYLEGAAPDGLMGLGFREISVPSSLAKAGLVQNSFSMCFNDDRSGKIYFGDKGPTAQQSTPFLPLDDNYVTYIVGVEACCIGKSCLKQTSFRAIVDSGSSFTYFPDEIYQKVTSEFHRRVNLTISSFEGYPWEYCYKTGVMPKLPSMKFVFPQDISFVVRSPVFVVNDSERGLVYAILSYDYGENIVKFGYGWEGLPWNGFRDPTPDISYHDYRSTKRLIGFCLALQSADEDIGVIGQDYMTGYRIVFDREKMKLGWSASNCLDLSDDGRGPVSSPNSSTPSPPPTNEQQTGPPGGHGVAPAVAGRAPSKTSAASPLQVPRGLCFLKLVIFFQLLLHALVSHA